LHPSHAHLDKLSTHFCRNRSKPLRLPALEDLCILLITNKASNILQDVDTLHLFARVMSDICRAAHEREIQKQSFELLGAFDEIMFAPIDSPLKSTSGLLPQMMGTCEVNEYGFENEDVTLYDIIISIPLP
jgi:hypothetical protein